MKIKLNYIHIIIFVQNKFSFNVKENSGKTKKCYEN